MAIDIDLDQPARKRFSRKSREELGGESAENKSRFSKFTFKLKAAAVLVGSPLAVMGGQQAYQWATTGNPHLEMAKVAEVESLNTCTIASTDGIEVMVGATIDPDTGDAKAFTYARPGSDSPSEAAFSIDTVQESADDQGNVKSEEVIGDIIGITPNRKVETTQIYARNGAQIKEVRLNAQLVKPTPDGRTIEGACTTSVAIGRSLGD